MPDTTRAEPEQRPPSTTVDVAPEQAAAERAVADPSVAPESASRSALPPAAAAPAVGRAAGLVADGTDGPRRARLTGAMQRAAGNARTGALIAAGAPGGTDGTVGATPPVRGAPVPSADASDTAGRSTRRAGTATEGDVRPAPAAPTLGAGRPSEATASIAPASTVGTQQPTSAADLEPSAPAPVVEPSAAPRGESLVPSSIDTGSDPGAGLVRPATEPVRPLPATPDRPDGLQPVVGGGSAPVDSGAREAASEVVVIDGGTAPGSGAVATGGATDLVAPGPDDSGGRGPVSGVVGVGDGTGTPAPGAAEPGAGEPASAEAAVAPFDTMPGVSGRTSAVGPAGGPSAAAPSGPVLPDTGLGAEPEPGGDPDAAADEMMDRLDDAAPLDEADETAGADEVEVTAIEPPVPEPEEPAAPEPSSEPSSAVAAPAAPAAPPSPEIPSADTQASQEDAAEEREPTGADAEPAALSTTEIDTASSVLADDAGPEPAAGGGGAGVAVPDLPVPATPDVSGLDPGAALSEAGSAPPAQLAAALGGVRDAVGTSVGDRRAALAAAPPSVERPAGRGAADRTRAPAERTPERDGVEKVAEGRDSPIPEPLPLPEPPTTPVEAVREPAVGSTPDGTLTEHDAARLAESVDALPGSDPALYATAGPAPRVPIEGNTDPARTDEQHATMRAGVHAASVEGRIEAMADLGENDVHPGRAARALTASGAGTGAGSSGSPPATGPSGQEAEAASIVAGQEKGAEISAAVRDARAGMAATEQEHSDRAARDRATSAEEIAALDRADAREQGAVRGQVRAEVARKRGEWTDEQAAAVVAADGEATTKVTAARREVAQEKAAADTTAGREIAKGNADAAQARIGAEQEAARKKKEAEQESSGVLGWLASKAKSFFNRIKKEISEAFAHARRALKAAITKAKQLASRAIEAARKKIVAAIRTVGAALIAIGDRALRAFPTLRRKFRAAITSAVDAAVTKVNKMAADLDAAVQKRLDDLGRALDAALGWLERGLLAAVDFVASAVDSALKSAAAWLQAVGGFAVLIRDVAAGPLQWLKNLGAGAVDGIRNHLWTAFRSAVAEWFTTKVEQVLGLGAAVWKVLTDGGLTVAQIGRMAWEGIKSMIPPAVVRIVIEKLVSMIVPAAGAVMVIIEGLQAAWGAASRILAAFSKFMAFLRAVRSGTAGRPFADAVAAAAVAVIDFIANWLLAKLAKGAIKVAGRFKGLASRLMSRKRGRAGDRSRRGRTKSSRTVSDRRSRTRKSAKKPRQEARREESAKRRLQKADRFVKRSLARGVSSEEGLARIASQAERKFRLRSADLTVNNDTARIVLVVNPAKTSVASGKLNVETYRRRAERLYQLLMHHHLHHIYPKENVFSEWWEALEVDHHAPENMLEIPLMLHQQGVHQGFKKLKGELLMADHKKLVKRTEYEWNASWSVWLQLEKAKEGIVNIAQSAKDSAKRDRIRTRAKAMEKGLIKIWSRKLEVDLSSFRLSSPGSMTYRERFGAPLRKMIDVLRSKDASRRQIRDEIHKFAEGKVTELREEWRNKGGG